MNFVIKNRAHFIASDEIYKVVHRVTLRSPNKSTETFHDVEIDLAVKKLLIIFKNKIDGLSKQ